MHFSALTALYPAPYSEANPSQRAAAPEGNAQSVQVSLALLSQVVRRRLRESLQSASCPACHAKRAGPRTRRGGLAAAHAHRARSE
jgi:hypothetical protein